MGVSRVNSKTVQWLYHCVSTWPKHTAIELLTRLTSPRACGTPWQGLSDPPSNSLKRTPATCPNHPTLGKWQFLPPCSLYSGTLPISGL